MPSVLIVASEAVPFAKTGGLADVVGALAAAVARLGWDVTVAIPRYRGVAVDSPAVERFQVNVGRVTADVSFLEAPMQDGARALLVDCPDMFDRESLYGPDNTEYPDNPLRFALLARSVLELVARRGAGPSVFHVHDWQTGLVPVYLQTLYRSHPVLGGIPTVLTIHNLAYQGNFDSTWLPRLDLGWDQFTPGRMEYWGRISFLKGGINSADLLTTVSPRYAEEIQAPEMGFGFDGIVRARRDRLVGILNGIDTREWDPGNDRFLPEPFGAADLSGKAVAKAALIEQYGLPQDTATLKRPIVAMVSRMVDQKGLDLIAALGEDLARLDATFITLGEGDPRYQRFWLDLAASHPDRIAVRVGFDEGLAHLIEGGADLFLMPSRYEPCGLNQMYSLRYGTVPVVRAVGGLADTVHDYSLGAPHANGFVFQEYSPGALRKALVRALGVFRDRAAWRELQRSGMAADPSWDRSAAEYVKIYRRAGEVRSGGR